MLLRSHVQFCCYSRLHIRSIDNTVLQNEKEKEVAVAVSESPTAISNLIETTNTPYTYTIVLLNNFVDVISFMSWTIDYRVAVQERKSRQQSVLHEAAAGRPSFARRTTCRALRDASCMYKIHEDNITL